MPFGGPDFGHMSSKDQWITTRMYDESHKKKPGRPKGGSGCLTVIAVVAGISTFVGSFVLLSIKALAM